MIHTMECILLLNTLCNALTRAVTLCCALP